MEKNLYVQYKAVIWLIKNKNQFTKEEIISIIKSNPEYFYNYFYKALFLLGLVGVFFFEILRGD